MTTDERERIEKRLEAFDHNADELWRVWHDPALVAKHLSTLLKPAKEVVEEIARAEA